MDATIQTGRDLNFTVSQAGAQIIRDAVIKDPVALENWKHVKDDFIFEAPDRRRIASLLDEHEYHSAVLKTLEVWLSTWGQGATLTRFLEILRLHGLNRLAEELESTSEVIQGARFPQCSDSTDGDGIWFGMTDVVHNFAGRVSELQQLHNFVVTSHSHSYAESCYALLTSVYGLGGIGKTSLARKYAWSYRSYFNNNVVWVEAETYLTMINSFQKLGKALQMTPKAGGDSKDLVRSIYKHIGHRKCLFIFDNASEYDGPDGIKHFLPDGALHKPHLLITSRQSDIVRNRKVLNLDVLSNEDAIKLVLTELPGVGLVICRELCEKLGRLPLALQQAIAYIADSVCHYRTSSEAVAAYLREFETNAKRIFTLGHTLSDGYKQTVYLTWQVTLEKLRTVENGDSAMCLLRYLAYLSPENIHVEFVLKLYQKIWREQHGDLLVESNASSKFFLLAKHLYLDSGQLPVDIASIVRKLIELLVKFSMISAASGVIKVHRLVQEVVKLDVDVDNEHGLIQVILGCIEHNMDSHEYDEQSILHGSALLPYFNKLPPLKSRRYVHVHDRLSRSADLVKLVTSEFPKLSRELAVGLLGKIGQDLEAVRCAVDFITEFGADDSAIAAYLNSKVSEEFAILQDYTNPKIRVLTFNWLSFVEWTKNEPRSKLAVQLMKYLAYIDHRNISKQFLLTLVEEAEDFVTVTEALAVLEQYNFIVSIDLSTVKLNRNYLKFKHIYTLDEELKILKSIVASMLKPKQLNLMLHEQQLILHTARVYKNLCHFSVSEDDTNSNFVEFIEKKCTISPLILTFKKEIPSPEEIETCKQLARKLHNAREAIITAAQYISCKESSPSVYMEMVEERLKVGIVNVTNAISEEFMAIVVAVSINLDVLRTEDELVGGVMRANIDVELLKLLLYFEVDKFLPWTIFKIAKIEYKDLDDIAKLGFVQKVGQWNYFMKRRIQEALKTILEIDEAEEIDIIRKIAKFMDGELRWHPNPKHCIELSPDVKSHLQIIMPYLQKYVELSSQFPRLIEALALKV